MVKKDSEDNINSKLALTIKSGKVVLGTKTVLKSIRKEKAKLIFISNNCPPIRKSQIEYYAMLAKVKIYLYPGNNVALGIHLHIHIYIYNLYIFILLFLFIH